MISRPHRKRLVRGPGHTEWVQCPNRVWYLAYGSNVNEQRFLRYLQGDDSHLGARDSSEPTESVWAQLPFELTFERQSQRWKGGGVAFVHPSAEHTAWFRAWNISGEQFEDVFAQENRTPVGTGLDWNAIASGSVDVGTGWYRRIMATSETDLGDISGLTFTTADRQTMSTPSPDYAETIAAGLKENPHLSPHEADAYLQIAIDRCR